LGPETDFAHEILKHSVSELLPENTQRSRTNFRWLCLLETY